MPFKKGHKLANGRPKGSKNQKTKAWEELGECIATTHTDRFNKILSKANDGEFVDLYLKTLEYFQPKLQRTDNTTEHTFNNIPQWTWEPVNGKKESTS